MKSASGRFEPVWWEGDGIGYIDQRKLPGETVRARASGVDEVVAAIATLAVRGAPCIGIFGAYGVALARQLSESDADFAAAAQRIRAARPTAVNLAWAVDRVLARRRAGVSGASESHSRRAARGRSRHRRIRSRTDSRRRERLDPLQYGAARDRRRRHGAGRHRGRAARGKARPRVRRRDAPALTRRALDDGRAAGCGRSGHADRRRRGRRHDARQGRDLRRSSVPTALRVTAIPPIRSGRTAWPSRRPISASPSTSRRRARRSTSHSKAARASPIEERSPDEVRAFGTARSAPEAIGAYNPAFDVTPGHLIAGIVTEYGVARPPYAESLADLAERPRFLFARSAGS